MIQSDLLTHCQLFLTPASKDTISEAQDRLDPTRREVADLIRKTRWRKIIISETDSNEDYDIPIKAKKSRKNPKKVF